MSSINIKVLKKLSKAKLLRLLIKERKSKLALNHENVLNDENPFKNNAPQPIVAPKKHIPKPTRKAPPPPTIQVKKEESNIPPSKISELKKALKGHAKSYSIELQDNLNPLNHFNKTKELIKSHLETLSKEMKGFKFIETLEITFEKAKQMDTMIYKMAFFNGKAKTITKVKDIDHELSVSKLA